MDILIADGSTQFCSDLAAILSPEYGILTAHTGRETLHIMQTLHPDVLVLDLLLPEIDGISVLHAAMKNGGLPPVLATSQFFNDYIIQNLHQLDVQYVMTKPCDTPSAADRIRDLCQSISSGSETLDERTEISHTLLQLGINTKHKGYRYLREAIYLIAQDSDLSITKELYPTVAIQCGSTSAHVERCIRNAIHIAWEKRDKLIWRDLLPGSQNMRPSNGIFIWGVADKLVLRRKITTAP